MTYASRLIAAMWAGSRYRPASAVSESITSIDRNCSISTGIARRSTSVSELWV